MVHQERYPNIVVQENETDEGYSIWKDLENIKIDNWESLASCYLPAHNKPGIVVAKDFNFNIPKYSKISQIIVFYNFHKEASENQISIDAPNIELNFNNKSLELETHVDANVFPVENMISFNQDLEDLTYEDIENLSVKIHFPNNSEDNEGVLFLDYVRVLVAYDTEEFLIYTDEDSFYYPTEENPIVKSIGEEIKYTVTFKNLNGICKDKQEVFIQVPEGLEIVDYTFKEIGKDYSDNKFDPKTCIWYPPIRDKGMAVIKLTLKCIKEGTFYLKAFNEKSGISPNFYVEIHNENFKSPESKFEKNQEIWESELLQDENFLLMNKETSIKVDNVTMEFEIPSGDTVDSFKEYVTRFIKRDLPSKTKFKALSDVSFEVNKGERVGIIGFNGAGKSTLLKILSNVLKPTEGSIYTNGKVAPLLELGAGFDHNYSGRENIFLNGAILGYSKRFLESKVDEIIDFSELGEFIDIPIKNYSSGMLAKLGFSVATIVEPDILILDEILSVGDVKFQKKSGDKIKSMMKTGVTVLVVSHSVPSIRELCNRAIWLKDGKVFMDGDVDNVCDAYVKASDKASEEEIANLEFD